MNRIRHGFGLALLTISCLAASAQAGALGIDLTPVSGSSTSVSSVTVSILQAGQFITVGDKIFTGFSYSSVGEMPAANLVQVFGFQDASGNWGLSFHGSFFDLPGGAISGADLQYTVTVDPAFAAKGWFITDGHLELLGSGLPSSPSQAVSAFTVDETLNVGITQVGALSVFNSSVNGATLTAGTGVNPGRTSLLVVTDLLAIAPADATLPAHATVINETFSQAVVPLPPAALSGAALLTVLAGAQLTRRRKAVAPQRAS